VGDISLAGRRGRVVTLFLYGGLLPDHSFDLGAELARDLDAESFLMIHAGREVSVYGF
jgi:hypothetical protein